MRRSLVIEGAPDGTVPSGATDASCVAGGSPDAKVRGASGRGLLGRDSRQRGVLALGLVVASGKPNASVQAVVRCTQAGCSYSHVLRESGAACR